MHIINIRISIFVLLLTAFTAACGDDGGDNTPDGQNTQLSCSNYCTTLMSNCSAANQQFGTIGECMSSCTHYPLGAAADLAGNTLGCRTYHAGTPAVTDPTTHCRHAGPGGANGCGANCEGFCTLVLSSCTGGNQQYNGDMGACLTSCGTFNTTPLYDASKRGGDTFACRLYHATAASADPGLHCKHTAAISDTCKP